MDKTEAFTIECKNEEAVYVDEEPAKVLIRHCEYFRNLFRHGTRESEERRIKKPDWSVENTKRLVELLSKMRVTLPLSDVQSVYELVESTNQILVAWGLYVKLEGAPFSFALDAKLTRFLIAAITQSTIKLVIKTQMSGLSWKLLLEHGYFLQDRHVSITFDRLKRNVSQKEATRQLAARLPSCEYEVSVISPCPLELPAVANNICKGLHVVESKIDRVARRRQSYHRRRPNVFSEESFSLRLSLGINCRKQPSHNNKRPTRSEGNDFFMSFLEDLCFDNMEIAGLYDVGPVSEFKSDMLESILQETGADGFFFESRKKNPGYFIAYSQGHDVHPTFTGTPSQLRECLRRLLEEEQEANDEAKYKVSINHQVCSLRVAAPTNETLGHLIEACRLCEDHRGTLGVDIRSKAYYAVKTVSDMQLLLNYLAHGPQQKEADNQDLVKEAGQDIPLFKLQELTQPRGAF